jgi:P pilus assembly chaperone PapD
MLTFRFVHHYGKLTAAPLLFWLAVAPQAARAQYGFALSPMRTELNLTPSGQRNGSLSLANDDKTPGRYRAEVLDLSIDGEAVPQFEKDIPSEADFSCKDWITANPMEAEIAGSGQIAVRYTVHVPVNAPPRTYHCALGFTSLPDARTPREAMGIVALLRLTSTFYITVGNPAPAGEVKQIAIEKISAPETSGYRAVISVENAGMTNLRGAGKVEIVTEGGEVVQTSDFPPVVILPGRTQRLPLVLDKKVTDGNYTLRARVNLGNGEIQEAALRFRLPAPVE